MNRTKVIVIYYSVSFCQFGTVYLLDEVELLFAQLQQVGDGRGGDDDATALPQAPSCFVEYGHLGA
jgi:hypothetical protein